MKKVILMIILFCSVIASQDVSITVYNQNRALVKDVRSLTLEKGISAVSFTDVASQIDPTSVHFKSLTSPDKVQVLEQNYEYDLVGGSKILTKYVDQEIRLVTEKGELFQGRLLTAASDIVLQGESGGIKILKQAQIQYFDLPRLPSGLITRPTLMWQIKNSGPTAQSTEISYLTSGMNWHAEYVAVANDDSRLELSGWVSIENQSGAAYENAKLKLVAGDVNLVQPERMMPKFRSDEMYTLAEAEPQFEEKAFFEYHLYTLQRRTTLRDQQTKQISLFPSAMTQAQKIFICEATRYGNKIRVYLEVQNRKEDGLGLPLPRGTVRVYKADTDGALEFIGEDRIDHTAINEKVRLFLGNAFDLTGERVVMDSRQYGDRSREETVEIVLKNHKKEDVNIMTVEHFGTGWRIIKSSEKHRLKDAYTAEFDVTVPAGGEVKLNYTVLLTW